MINHIIEILFSLGARDAWAAYSALEHPTGEDDRFGAAALINLGDLVRAKHLCMQARSKGCDAANIELAGVYWCSSQPVLAKRCLESLNVAALPAFDRALYWVLLAYLRLDEDTVDLGIEALETALALTFEEGAEILRAGIAGSLGSAYSQRGWEALATEYYNLALEQVTPPHRAFTLTSRASSLIFLGQLDRAQRDLDDASTSLNAIPALRLLHTYTQAHLLSARGQRQQALELFTLISQEADQQGRHLLGGYAELAACALVSSKSTVLQARGFLARAKQHLNDVRGLTMVELREASLLALHDPEAATLRLQQIINQFEAMQRHRETAWGCVQLASAYHRLGRLDDLERVMHHIIGKRGAVHDAAIALEILNVPELQEYLLGTIHAPLAKALEPLEVRLTPKQVRVVTLGEGQLIVDGQVIGLNLARAIEVLAFLLEHPHQTLQRIITEVFEHWEPKRAKNYFHQVRYDLMQLVPGLEIRFDKTTNCYDVHCPDIEVQWDVAEWRKAAQDQDWTWVLEAFERGPGEFLESCDASWAHTLREDVIEVVCFGAARLVEHLCNSSQPQRALDIGLALLSRYPYNQPLLRACLLALRTNDSSAQKTLTLQRLKRLFETELGHVPRELISFAI